MKTHILLALVGLVIGFVLPTFAQDTVDPKTAQQIRALTAKFNEAFNKHDPAAVAALYTEDAVWQTYHGTYYGRQHIEKVYTDWCCDLGGGGADNGLCSWVLVHEGDTWKIRREALTSDHWVN
jgi:hypothetical protein